MKKIFFAVVMIASQMTFAQAGNENVSFSTGNFFTRANRPSSKDYVIDGSPYTSSKDFAKVIIANYSKDVQPLRYNAYEDEMEFSQNNETFFANKEEGLKINFPDLKKTYVCLNYRIDDKSKLGYLVLLQDGTKTKLYKREKVELLKGEKSPNAYGKDANDYYAKEKDVYLIYSNNSYYKIPKNMKDFVSLPLDNKEKISDFVKSNKINLSKEADLIKLVEFINQN
ncbi:hypothetical protein SAMN05660477_01278 [Soonwooa buanensis]|uniref:GLPGLI family protein n=1 Tax=Soonwooa buanensis TaxID=619805 RepID=A0A1T5EBS7_9FLAO|nr:hypothetical protein [Soonwooa buanensis]SKB81517.1 hypothetical protein SAMN05660477_01278 [Soonwooa buanensis]